MRPKMYQKTYYGSNSKKNGKGLKIILVGAIVIILGVGLYYLGKLGAKVEETTQAPTTQEPTITSTITSNRFVGRSVQFSGTIAGVEGTIGHTHTITTEGGETIKVFSSTRNLHSNSGIVYVKGKVAVYDGTDFIVDIEQIGSSPDALDTLTLTPSTQSRIIASIGLKIDTTNNNDISYTVDGQTIEITVNEFSTPLKLQGFRCERGVADRDCEQLTAQYTGGSFTSAGGMTYAKGADNKRFALNGNGAGYIIASESDAMLYRVSNSLIPLNENYVRSLSTNAASLCGALGTVQTTTVRPISFTEWTLSLEGSANGNKTTCTVRVTFTDAGETLRVESSTGGTGTGSVSAPSTQNPGTQTPVGTTSGSTTPPAPNNSATPPPQTGSGLTFTSTRGGYGINFPSARITYAGTNIQENLGVEGLNCYVRIDVKDFNDRENDSVGPAVSIYECTSRLSSEDITAKTSDYIFKTSADGTKLFFIKTWNTNRSGFSQGISIQ